MCGLSIYLALDKTKLFQYGSTYLKFPILGLSFSGPILKRGILTTFLLFSPCLKIVLQFIKSSKDVNLASFFPSEVMRNDYSPKGHAQNWYFFF